jgi:hypothetical protein
LNRWVTIVHQLVELALAVLGHFDFFLERNIFFPVDIVKPARNAYNHAEESRDGQTDSSTHRGKTETGDE